MKIAGVLIGVLITGVVQAAPNLPEIKLEKVSEALSMIKRDAFGDLTLNTLKRYSANGETLNVEKKFPSAEGAEHKLIISVNKFRVHVIYWAEVIEPGKDYPFFDVGDDKIINKLKSLKIELNDADIGPLSGQRWEWENNGFSCHIKASTVSSTSKELWYECIYR